jgi:hypothetical protein
MNARDPLRRSRAAKAIIRCQTRTLAAPGARWHSSGYHGTLVNTPAWVDGHTGKALRFDGANRYVQIPNLPHLPQWHHLGLGKQSRPPASFSQTDSGPIHREKNFQINWNHNNVAFRGAAP